MASNAHTDESAAVTRDINPMPDVEPRYRVLMIAPTSFFADYGCHVRILEETRVLQKLGHQVTIATYRNGGDVPGLDIQRTLPIPWRREYEVGSSRHKIAFDALLGAKTLQLLLRRRFDLIHAHLHEGALIGQALGRLFRIPVVFDFQGSMTEEMVDHHFVKRDSFSYGLWRRLETHIDRAADTIFTSTAQAAQILVDRFGCQEERVQTLPDCVDTDVFRPAEQFDPQRLADLRQQLGIPPDAKLIVYLGLLTAYQGTDHLLTAMTRILHHHSNVYLLLMGFPNVDVYQLQSQALGIREKVIFTGRIPYGLAPYYLALGDVAVAPKMSKTEGAGKILNYMATALPTVTFDTPVARELLGMHGIYADFGDAESLAERLRACLFPPAQEADTYRAVGQRLRTRAVQQFSWQHAGRQIVETYARLVGDHPSQMLPRQWGTDPRA